MTRKDVKTAFPDATDEQLTAILNMHNGEVIKAKSDEAQKTIAELQQQIEPLLPVETGSKAGKVPLEELIQTAIRDAETARKGSALLQSRLSVEKVFAGAGLAECDYADLLSAIVGEDAEASVKVW